MWFRFDPANYSIGSRLYVSSKRGWSTHDVAEYTVTKITPSGQVVAERKVRDDYTDTIRVNKRGTIVGDSSYSRGSIVSAEDAAELRADARKHDAWRKVRDCGEAIEKAARSGDHEALAEAIAELDVARKALAGAEGIAK